MAAASTKGYKDLAPVPSGMGIQVHQHLFKGVASELRAPKAEKVGGEVPWH